MKKLILLILVLALTITLAACGLTDEPNKDGWCDPNGGVFGCDVEECPTCEVCEIVDPFAYDLVEVEIIEVNSPTHLVQTTNLFTPTSYVVVTNNDTLTVGSKIYIAVYDNGDIRLWNELKELEGE